MSELDKKKQALKGLTVLELEEICREKVEEGLDEFSGYSDLKKPDLIEHIIEAEAKIEEKTRAEEVARGESKIQEAEENDNNEAIESEEPTKLTIKKKGPLSYRYKGYSFKRGDTTLVSDKEDLEYLLSTKVLEVTK